MTEVLELSMRDLDRLKVIRDVLEGRLTRPQAAEQLDLSPRQVRRLCQRVSRQGPRGLVHRLRGKPSNRTIDESVVKQALALIAKNYADFGPTLSAEKLLERHGLEVSITTLRRRMLDAGLWKSRAYRKRHRAWRQRRACIGELVQVDGSIHDWFEGRGPRCWLIAFVDDATSKLMYAEFAEAEDTLTLMRLARSYLRRHGRPLAFYVDQDSIYKTNRNADLDEAQREQQPMTQFTRAMTELGIQVICARSPQAKGRVERGFKTHQNRLVKELRLAGISTITAANEFLRKNYAQAHNRRFAIDPASQANAHRTLHPSLLLDRILSVRTIRTIQNDFTVRWEGRYIQLLEQQPVKLKPSERVEIESRLDRTLHVRFEGRYLNYKTIPKPSRRSLSPVIDLRSFVQPKPLPALVHAPADHPWRKLGYFQNAKTRSEATPSTR